MACLESQPFLEAIRAVGREGRGNVEASRAWSLVVGHDASALLDILAAKASTVMTNVPGPQKQLYLAGLPIKEFMFWVPQSGRLGLGVSIIRITIKKYS